MRYLTVKELGRRESAVWKALVAAPEGSDERRRLVRRWQNLYRMRTVESTQPVTYGPSWVNVTDRRPPHLRG